VLFSQTDIIVTQLAGKVKSGASARSISSKGESPVTPDVKIYLPKASQMTPSGTFITGFDAYF
jgi:hypothetical protein